MRQRAVVAAALGWAVAASLALGAAGCQKGGQASEGAKEQGEKAAPAKVAAPDEKAPLAAKGLAAVPRKGPADAPVVIVEASDFQ